MGERHLSPRRITRLLGRAMAAWWSDNLLRLGASIAFYTLFAIAPILLVAVAVAGAAFGDEAVRGEVAGQIDGLVGPDGAAAVQALIEGARRPTSGAIAFLTGAITTVLAACGVFLELQAALNYIWRVPPAAPRGVVGQFFRDRAQSFGVVLSIGFLLLVSLAVSAAVAAIGTWIDGRMPGAPLALSVLNWIISVAFSAVLFAMLFKVLPDVTLTYGDVTIGGLITALLFTVGKHGIGFYLGHSGGASSYGAVGSVAVLLIWVYYSSQIFLIGAQFTRFFAERDVQARLA